MLGTEAGWGVFIPRSCVLVKEERRGEPRHLPGGKGSAGSAQGHWQHEGGSELKCVHFKVEIWAFVFTVSPHLARTWFTLILNEYLTNEGKRKKPSAQNRSHWIEAGFSGELRLRWAVVDELGVYLVEK